MILTKEQTEVLVAQLLKQMPVATVTAWDLNNAIKQTEFPIKLDLDKPVAKANVTKVNPDNLNAKPAKLSLLDKLKGILWKQLKRLSLSYTS